MAQDRKVFVGGVPQNMNQEDLYNVFAERAPVRKAWLQMCRTVDSNASPQQNHRGFGFVIFQDSHAIEALIGSNPSRFITLKCGAKLEVKRAVSSNKIGRENRSENDIVEENHVAGGDGQKVRLLGGGRAPWVPNSAPVFATVPRSHGLMVSEPQPALPPHYVGGPMRPHGPDLPRAAATHGFCHAARPRGPREPPSLREHLFGYYQHFAPEKLQDALFLDSVVQSYCLREDQLNQALREKYGVGLFDFHGGMPGLAWSRGPSRLGLVSVDDAGRREMEQQWPEQKLCYDPAVLIPGPAGLVAAAGGSLGAKFEEEDGSLFQYGPGRILESCLAEKSDGFLAPRELPRLRPGSTW